MGGASRVLGGGCVCGVLRPVVLVGDIGFGQRRYGSQITTQCTDINRVAAHTEKYRVRLALLATDGLVGQSSWASERIPDKTALTVGLARLRRALGDLATFTSHCAGFEWTSHRSVASNR